MMESGSVTTPFGRRSMTLGMLASQAMVQEISPDSAVDKWMLYRALCSARARLGVSDRALAVLNALLSFYPKTELTGADGLVVFPSNTQLSLRTHGMAETTLRRHLAALVEAGLLIRKDSPNGKRYARKDREGGIDEAYGFSLAPLLARAGEIEHIAAEVTAERLFMQRLKERLTLCRRDIAKLIETALEEGAPGDWTALHAQFRGIVLSLPRKATSAETSAALDAMTNIRSDIVKRLESKINTKIISGNASQNERHIQNSNPEFTSELEPSFETKQGGTAEELPQPPTVAIARGLRRTAAGLESRNPAGQPDHDPPQQLRPFPLALVLQACPEIVMYGQGGNIANWRDLMTAAVVVRSMLGVSPSAYEEACAIMGPENAATVIACILERAGHITSAGGYIRDLTRRAERGEFSLGPMLMALARANGAPGRRTG